MQEIPQNTNEFVKHFAAQRQWVCHSNKVPLNPRTGFNASVTNPPDWTDYETAAFSAAANDGVGIGFVLTPADPYICIDLDTHKTTDQNIIALHEEIQRQFSNTYSERSPNGGTHIWVKGSIPRSIKSPQQHIEIYDRDRYLQTRYWNRSTCRHQKTIQLARRRLIHSSMFEARKRQSLPTWIALISPARAIF